MDPSAHNTAAGMMDREVVSIPVGCRVQEAISLLREAPRRSVHYLYVTDATGALAGVLTMRDLLLAAPADPVEPLMRRELASVSGTASRRDVAEAMRRHRFLALPVVDDGGRLLGVVKQREALNAVQEEGFEDLQRIVGAGGDEQATAPLGVAVRKRLPWLMVNLATAFLASLVISVFESTIARFSALAVLMPIVAGQGGNTGAQTLAVLIRGLALKEIRKGAAWRVLMKETAAGFVNGVAVAVVTSACVWAWYGGTGLALVIGLAMVANMVAAGISGAAIPLVLHALGRDPAQSSSIFMTTVTDVVGFAAFLGLGMLLLPGVG